MEVSKLYEPAADQIFGILAAKFVKIFSTKHFIFVELCEDFRIGFTKRTESVVRNLDYSVLESIMQCVFTDTSVIKEHGYFIDHIHSFRCCCGTDEMSLREGFLQVVHSLHGLNCTESMTFVTDYEVSPLELLDGTVAQVCECHISHECDVRNGNRL